LRGPSEDVFLEATGGDDFVGVQTYTRMRVGPDGGLGAEEGVPTTQMGWQFWSEALEAMVRRATAKTGGIPVYVTENGIGTAHDVARIEYVRRALVGLGRCLDDGIDVRGYCYWSLLDNFEWVLGYGPTFGLVAVDRRPSNATPSPVRPGSPPPPPPPPPTDRDSFRTRSVKRPSWSRWSDGGRPLVARGTRMTV
jgi:beta-glucosidase